MKPSAMRCKVSSTSNELAIGLLPRVRPTQLQAGTEARSTGGAGLRARLAEAPLDPAPHSPRRQVASSRFHHWESAVPWIGIGFLTALLFMFQLLDLMVTVN